MSGVISLLRKDFRTVARDRFLLFMCAYAPLLAWLFRLAVDRIPVENLDLYVAPFVVTLGGSLASMVFGLGLIEEREQRTWLLMRVVPFSRRAHSVYLVAVTTALAFVLGLTAAAVYGEPAADLPELVALTAVASLTAPLATLFLGVAASNKVEGMALAKIVSSMSVVPALAFVVPVPWQVTLVWSPHYWIYLGLLRAYAGEAQLESLAIQWPAHAAWIDTLVAGVLCLAGIHVLGRIERRRVH
ncbi:MAG: hypothetical protein ACE5IL_14155 [Myxococcota bacterium]